LPDNYKELQLKILLLCQVQNTFHIHNLKETYMSSITSALQYKVQKMQQQMNSLMEENAKLRSILSEADIAGMSPTQAFNYGGGAALGQNLAMQPNIGVAGMASAARGMSPTSTSAPGGPSAKPTAALGSRGMGSVAPGVAATQNMTPAARSLAAQAAGGGFNGAEFGAFLAGLAGNPNAAEMVAQYLGLPFAGGMQTASNYMTQTRRK
jgi:hypothetical protein